MAAESTWFILRAPGCVPELKRCNAGDEKRALLELMEHRPSEFITVLTFGSAGQPMVQDGPECLEMIDMRHHPRAARHRASTKAAFAAQK